MPRPCLAITAVFIAGLVVSGCGSGGRAKTAEPTDAASPSSEAIATDELPKGPEDPAENLEQLLPQATPDFEHVRVTCPRAADPPSYPFDCDFTADSRKSGSGVAGTITVHGVYTPTMTYVFETNYGPRGSR